jgi:AhpD family alkylhydroperoxidase
MHIPEPTIERVRWYLRPLFWFQRKRYGTLLLPALTWARVPSLYFALAGFYRALDRRGSPLDPVLRSLVQTRISQINHCAFCIDLNAAMAAERGGSMDKALAVAQWRTSDLFTPIERAALEFAEAVTRTGQVVDARLVARLRKFFDEDTLIEFTALVAFQNMSSKFNAALDIPSQGFCMKPAAEPVATDAARRA